MTRREAPHPRRVPTGGAARVLAGAALLLVAALAADAGGVAALPGRTRPAGWLSSASSAIGVTIGLAGLVVLAAIVALIARRPRRRRDEPPRVVILPTTSRLTQVLVLLVVIGVLAAPFVLLVTTPRHPAASRPPTSITATTPSERTNGHHPSSATGARHHGHSLLLLGVITGAVVAAAAGAAVRRRDTEVDASADANEDDPHLRADVEAAAAAATTALDTADGDPRQAVIAAYKAMTRALTAADPRLRATDTPGRLLDRAVAAGIVDVGAASTLIRLFERARFSTHAVTPLHVAAAREALDRVRITSATPAGAP